MSPSDIENARSHLARAHGNTVETLPLVMLRFICDHTEATSHSGPCGGNRMSSEKVSRDKEAHLLHRELSSIFIFQHEAMFAGAGLNSPVDALTHEKSVSR